MLCISLFTLIDDLASMQDGQLVARLSCQPCPVRSVRTNAGPTIMPLWEAPEDLFNGISCEELEARATRVTEDDSFKVRLVKSYLETRPEYPEPSHVEEMLYTKFSSWNDVALCKQFHNSPVSERPIIAKTFEDDRLIKLALRVSYFENRSSLSPETARRMDIDLAKRLLSTDTKPPSIENALKQIDEVRESQSLEQDAATLLKGYETFLTTRRSKILKFLEAK